jgi:DNA-binding beta-propeller fold protein YncE
MKRELVTSARVVLTLLLVLAAGASTVPAETLVLRVVPLALPPNSGPEAVAFDGTYVWVAGQFSNAVTRLRPSDGQQAGIFTVGQRPVAVLADASGIWVANLLDNTVTKLRASNGAPLGTFAVGANPYGVAFDGANIWVANTGSNTVSKR